MKASNSAIQTFKACRRLYELKYIYDLEPVQQADTLKRGTSYHSLVEQLLNGADWNIYANPDFFDDPKPFAMATAFQKYVLPKISAAATEEWFNYKTPSGHTVVGRIDGRTPTGQIIEHKTTSGLVDGAYLQRLDFDEQIPTYMIAYDTNEIWYTVCATPTIRQKKNELVEEFFLRCVDWYAEDTDSKITCVKLNRSPEQLQEFLKEQDAILTEMENCKLFYRNPSHCMKWGRMCEFAPVCMNYDPNEEYIQFKRRVRYDTETGKAIT